LGCRHSQRRMPRTDSAAGRRACRPTGSISASSSRSKVALGSHVVPVSPYSPGLVAAARRLSMTKKAHGRTASETPITDELGRQARREDRGRLRRRGDSSSTRGRPPIGSAAASVESVRLEPELRQALAHRAKRDHETTSSVIRKALREYLKVARSPLPPAGVLAARFRPGRARAGGRHPRRAAPAGSCNQLARQGHERRPRRPSRREPGSVDRAV
jgi:hypothetical protein